METCMLSIDLFVWHGPFSVFVKHFPVSITEENPVKGSIPDSFFLTIQYASPYCSDFCFFFSIFMSGVAFFKKVFFYHHPPVWFCAASYRSCFGGCCVPSRRFRCTSEIFQYSKTMPSSVWERQTALVPKLLTRQGCYHTRDSHILASDGARRSRIHLEKPMLAVAMSTRLARLPALLPGDARKGGKKASRQTGKVSGVSRGTRTHARTGKCWGCTDVEKHL